MFFEILMIFCFEQEKGNLNRARESQQSGFRPGSTHTGLNSHRSRLEALNFGFQGEK